MKVFVDRKSVNYRQLQEIDNKSWICGYCTHKVASDRGYRIGPHSDGSGSQIGGVYICPNCGAPTFFSPQGDVLPSPAYGNAIEHLPLDIEVAYEEARRCTSQNCHTAAVLLCRKILMNIAVNQGAKEGLRFIEYVNFLSENGYVPPNGKHWVDHIRKKGNEATHEISVMKPDDAKEIIVFTEMLLKFVYEFPAMISSSQNS